jgi:hypothetical protein
MQAYIKKIRKQWELHLISVTHRKSKGIFQSLQVLRKETKNPQGKDDPFQEPGGIAARLFEVYGKLGENRADARQALILRP